jgi:hypothetical protein
MKFYEPCRMLCREYVTQGTKPFKFCRLASALGLGATVLLIISCGSSSNSTSSNPFSSDPPATVPLVQLSSDPFTNLTSQHATEVEPGSFSFGSTVITSFQVGRISGGGASDIGFAISNDGGTTWQNGLLPGLTTFQGAGANSAVSDTAVIYDAKHGVWMIASLPISSTNIQVAVSRSTDGGASWSGPVIVAQGPGLDKDWITCDNTPTSPHYGNCYTEWDDNGNSNLMFMSTSSDGGLSWSAGAAVAAAEGLGGQPLVQPSGTVIVPFLANAPLIQSFSSTDGGTTWGNVVQVATVTDHQVAGGAQRRAAFGAGRRSRQCLCGLAGLPFSGELRVQRSGHEYFLWRHELDAACPDTNRRGHQHCRSLHSRTWH